MGNSESREEQPKSLPSSKSSTPQPLHPRDGEPSRDPKQNVSRKGQSQAANRTPAPPIASLVPSASATSTSTSQTHAHATVSHSPARTHSRQRSITSVVPPSLQPNESTASPRSDSSAMGNAESRQRPPSRSATLPTPSSEKERPQPSPYLPPVDVPQASLNDGNNEKEIHGGEPGPESPYNVGPSNYNRAPRLPLPIDEQEMSTAGSPIIAPQDLSSPLEPTEVDGMIPRRSSVLSSTTVDDEDVGDPDIFVTESQSLAPTVPTTFEWKSDAEKVYVTGTFVNWERKFRLHKDPQKGIFTATLTLKPGTHHLKFLVDDDMVTSQELPTTVDWTNILVNYIEVVAPMPAAVEVQQPAPAEPMPIPGAATTAGQATGTTEPASRPLDIRTEARAPETVADLPSTLQETVAPEIQRPPLPEQPISVLAPIVQPQPAQPRQSKSKQRAPRPKYTNQIPQFLKDLDLSNPDDERCQRANSVAHYLPQPPSLPMFLGKSILNGATPHKDDASVLIMPNHTVINHLATSSIKNGVLATSGTTRYKKKFLTTIIYKPTTNVD